MIFGLLTGLHAQAQLQDDTVHYAVLQLNSYSVGPYPKGYWKEKSRLSNEAERKKDPTYEDDEIIVSNSCGQETTKWTVVTSTIKLPETITVTRGIGEWCRLSENRLYDQVFAIFKKDENDPVEQYKIYKTDTGEPVLLIDEEEFDYLKDTGYVSHHINYKTYKDPIGAPDYYNAYDSRTQASVALHRHMKIINFKDSDKKRVVFTRAIPLKAFFPDIEAEENPIE